MNIGLIFGFTRLLLGILIGLYAFRVFEPKKNGFIAKNPIFFKILAIILLISGIFEYVR